MKVSGKLLSVVNLSFQLLLELSSFQSKQWWGQIRKADNNPANALKANDNVIPMQINRHLPEFGFSLYLVCRLVSFCSLRFIDFFLLSVMNVSYKIEDTLYNNHMQ